MAKTKKEEVAEQAPEQPKVDDKVEKIKVKKKPSMKKINKVDDIVKVDLSKPSKLEEDNIQESKTETLDTKEQTEVIEEVVDEMVENKKEEKEIEEQEEKEEVVLEEITEEKIKEDIEEVAEEAKEAINESLETGKPLPENIQKLMDFMEETGGDLNDYVRLNQDYSKLDQHSLLKEYYKQTKPHLNEEEVDFLMEDSFAYEEDVDDEKQIKRKKLALKEQVASAKAHLDGQKSKYYEDIKAGSKLTTEQQKAIDFFNRYNKDSKEQQKVLEKTKSNFLNKTNQDFNDNFKGFEYNIGEKKFRFNIKDVNKVKDNQNDISKFVGKFLDKNNQISDAKGYHKSLFTANNADAIANHFYQQGKADALKESIAKSKNISMDPRQQHSGEINTGGVKVRVLGDNSSDFKFKIKNK